VPEGMNVEIAHQLTEHDAPGRRHERWHELLEIVEVSLLAVVAVATAWSGLQAARWDGRQALRYGESSRLRFEADAASTRGGQELVADSAGFNTWLQAESAGNTKLMEEIERRFTPDYRSAFDAWLQTDPFTNNQSPPGPAYMPGYANPKMEEAAHLDTEASHKFDEGTEARETGEKYVRNTVLFASVLFLVALAQRQKARGSRLAANGIAVCLLAFTLISTVTLPRL
jgi:hypothetical protein